MTILASCFSYFWKSVTMSLASPTTLGALASRPVYLGSLMACGFHVAAAVPPPATMAPTATAPASSARRKRRRKTGTPSRTAPSTADPTARMTSFRTAEPRSAATVRSRPCSAFGSLKISRASASLIWVTSACSRNGPSWLSRLSSPRGGSDSTEPPVGATSMVNRASSGPIVGGQPPTDEQPQPGADETDEDDLHGERRAWPAPARPP